MCELCQLSIIGGRSWYKHVFCKSCLSLITSALINHQYKLEELMICPCCNGSIIKIIINTSQKSISLVITELQATLIKESYQ